MTHLLKKSQDNHKSALQLFGNYKYYAPSIHCAYYSCVQLMIHILLTAGKKTEKQIDVETQKESSHNYYIREVSELITKLQPGKLVEFNKIKELKKFRRSSDYKDIEITFDDANKATTYSEQINSTLKKVFNIL